MSSERTIFRSNNFAVVICRNFDGKWLAVKETRQRGWWIPAGAVDFNESFILAAHRECFEEAGIEIEIKGVLRVEHKVQGNQARMRVVFFAQPIDNK
jgi:8-oxo-dGTP pyrophosphatase MutT (NUDIX family)